jgi:AcrR family transcriptional regulator
LPLEASPILDHSTVNDIASAPKGRSRKASASARRARSTDGQVTRNADLSRREILAAAMHEFASKGVGGARIDQIAARYGGSKNLIYHYYKSKDGLFTAVLESMYATIREHQRDFEIEHSDPTTGIRDFVQFTIDVFDRNPEFVTLLHSENIAKARHVAGSQAIKAMYNRLLTTVDDLLARGAAQGIFKVRISAIDLYTCICARATFSISNRYTLSAIFGTDVNSAAKRKLRSRLAADMVLAYLTSG